MCDLPHLVLPAFVPPPLISFPLSPLLLVFPACPALVPPPLVPPLLISPPLFPPFYIL